MSRFKSIIFAWVYFFVLSGINPAFAAMPATTIEAGKTYVFAGVAFKASQLDADGSGTGQASLPFLDEIFPVRFEQLRLDEWGNIHSGRIYAAIAPEGFHPQTPAELAEWRTTARLAGAVPRLLDQWAAAQEITLGGHSLWMTGFEINPEGIFADLAFIAETPEDQLLVFNKEQVSVGAAGLEWCSLELALQGPVNTNDPEFPIKIKGNAQGTESFVVFDCEGFKAFSLSCEYAFPTPMFKAVQTLDPVKARFTIFGKSFNNFIGTATVDPFTVEGLDGFSFTVKNAVVDYSTDSISTTMKSALGQINYANNGALQSNHADKVWRGFFVENVDISLPGVFKDKNQQNQPFSIGVKNLILDGTVTGSVYAKPNIKTPGIEGWAISLDSVILEIVGSSITGDGVRVTGGVNIPIMNGKLGYEALFDGDNIGFAIKTEDTTEFSVPFLKEAKFTIGSGSWAKIDYDLRSKKFTPSANFNGRLIIEIQWQGIRTEIPALNIVGLKINDVSIQSNVSGITGGLDKISLSNVGTPGPQESKMIGFPLTIKNIDLQKINDGYALNFDVLYKMVEGLNNFSGEGQFAIIGNLNISKLGTDKPWEAIEFRKIEVKGVAIEAVLGSIYIKGGLRIIQNDATYGDGFKGAFSLQIRDGFPISVSCLAQFGTVNSFRYFFIDAEFTNENGIPIAATGLSFYGFSGGFFYNMAQAPSTLINKTSYASIEEVENSLSSLLEPGRSLSGYKYTPSIGSMSLSAGIIMGLSGAPQTFISEVTLRFEFSNSNNSFNATSIGLVGSAYIMSESVAKRESASIKGSLSLTYKFSDETLSGNLSANFNLPNLIEGGLASTGENIYFKNFKNFYFKIGEPNAPFNITLLNFASVQSYVMCAGGEITLPSPKNIATIFIDNGFENIPFPTNVSRGFINGSGGIAFGVQFKTGIQTTLFNKDNNPPVNFEGNLIALIGFDASILNTGPNCGINGWYLQGQAYAGFDGSLTVFLGGTSYQLARVTAAAALNTGIPNPSFFNGYIFGRYSLLNGTIQNQWDLPIALGDTPGSCGDPLPPPPPPIINCLEISKTNESEDDNELLSISGNTLTVNPICLLREGNTTIVKKDLLIFNLKLTNCGNQKYIFSRLTSEGNNQIETSLQNNDNLDNLANVIIVIRDFNSNVFNNKIFLHFQNGYIFEVIINGRFTLPPQSNPEILKPANAGIDFGRVLRKNEVYDNFYMKSSRNKIFLESSPTIAKADNNPDAGFFLINPFTSTYDNLIDTIGGDYLILKFNPRSKFSRYSSNIVLPYYYVSEGCAFRDTAIINLRGESGEPDILVNPNILDYGIIPIDSIKTKSFTIANNGNMDLIISFTDYSNSSNYYSGLNINPRLSWSNQNTLTIPPNSSISVSLSYECHKGELCGGKTIRATQKISSNDPDSLDVKFPTQTGKFQGVFLQQNVDAISTTLFPYKAFQHYRYILLNILNDSLFQILPTLKDLNSLSFPLIIDESSLKQIKTFTTLKEYIETARISNIQSFSDLDLFVNSSSIAQNFSGMYDLIRVIFDRSYLYDYKRLQDMLNGNKENVIILLSQVLHDSKKRLSYSPRPIIELSNTGTERANISNIEIEHFWPPIDGQGNPIAEITVYHPELPFNIDPGQKVMLPLIFRFIDPKGNTSFKNPPSGVIKITSNFVRRIENDGFGISRTMYSFKN